MAECLRDELAGGGEEDRGIELDRRPLRGVSRPCRAERSCECLGVLVPRARQRVDLASLVERNLADDVRRRAEAVEADPFCVARDPERAVADQPGAEKRRRLDVAERRRHGEAEPLVRDAELRVATVQVVAGEERAVAEVLTPGATVRTRAARPAEPRHSDAVARRESSGARHDLGDDLVTGDERELRPGQLAVDDVQVGAADAAREHAEERLSRAGLGIGQLDLPKRRASRRQHHRPHRRISTLLVMRELLDYRTEFPILERTTYLINHSLAAMPRRAEDRLAEYARMWAERGIRAWGEGWWTMPMTVGDQVGRIVGAPAGTTVMHQNVAVAEAVVLSCFRPFDPGRNRVVYERGNFPSVRYLYQAQPDLEVVVCEEREAGAIVDAIDERTLLVPISHVLFKTGEIQDVEPIVRRAHEVGAHVILDCYQSAGIVPLDVSALGVDFAVGGSVKWLCGGPGNGWLYVRPDLAETLEPTFTGWQAHEAPFTFEEEMRFATGAARFLTGTPNVPAHFAATAGYDLIEEVGIERIRANSLRQTQLLIDLADRAGFEVRSPRSAERRGGTVTVHLPDFPAVHRELAERQILCDFRPDAGIRLGPHFFTSDDELRFAIDQIGEIVETGAYERHLGAVAQH